MFYWVDFSLRKLEWTVEFSVIRHLDVVFKLHLEDLCTIEILIIIVPPPKYCVNTPSVKRSRLIYGSNYLEMIVELLSLNWLIVKVVLLLSYHCGVCLTGIQMVNNP